MTNNTSRGAGSIHAKEFSIDTARSLLAAIAAFTVVTATIHIAYAFPTPMFIASGVGYLILLAAFFTPVLRRYRGLIGAALAVFALGNIGLWFTMGARVPIAYAAKAFEVALLVALGAYLLAARRRSSGPVRVAPAPRTH